MKVEQCPMLGSEVLKSMLKLSYATNTFSDQMPCLMLAAISFDIECIALCIDVTLIDNPACARTSITFCGTLAE
jgi:hypothetical protein